MDKPIEAVEDFLVMGHGQDAGFLLGGKLSQQVHDQLCAFAVQGSGRLVRKDIRFTKSSGAG